jgi:hypothetical protein
VKLTVNEVISRWSNVGRIRFVVQKSKGEVTNQVDKEEGPITLRHSVRVIELVVDVVDPHGAEVVKQVLTYRFNSQTLKVVCTQLLKERIVARDCNIVSIGNRGMVLKVLVKCLADLCVGLCILCLLTCTQRVARAVRWWWAFTKSVQGSHSESEWRLNYQN